VNFEELDYRQTDLGELILRRRRALEADGRVIFEVKLNDEYISVRRYRVNTCCRDIDHLDQVPAEKFCDYFESMETL